MADQPQGPIDTIPKSNYLPLLTAANYLSTKQIINQVLSEDQEYVSWKLKEMRTGGTMNDFIDMKKYHFFKSSNSNKVHTAGRVKKPSRKDAKSKIGSLGNDDNVYNGEFIPGVPKDLTFVRDIYEQVHKDEISRSNATGFYDNRNESNRQPVEEEEEEEEGRGERGEEANYPKLSYEEQFKLLVLNLDEEQTERFEVFHRTALNKGQVKRLASTVCGQTISENIRVLLQAVGKIFAGEIIELALDTRQKWFISQMMNAFDRRKEIALRLKKYLKKLTLLAERTNGHSTGTSSNSESNKDKTENNNNNNNNNDMSDTNKADGERDESINNKTISKEDISIGEDGIAPDGDVATLEDSVNENESDFYYDDEESEMKDIKIGNKLLKSQKNTQEIRLGLITRYNKLVKEFNSIDVGVERFFNSPLLPEHVREAWRLYNLQGNNMPSRSWRQQGEGNGMMFR